MSVNIVLWISCYMKITDILCESSYEFRIKRLKLELAQSDKPNIFNSPEAVEKFIELANAQRYLPEKAMLQAQRIIGGGVLSNQLEHIGDLTHRIAERVFIANGLIEDAVAHIEPKVEKGLRSLKSGYGFEKEMHENFKSNWEYSIEKEGVYATFEDYISAIKEACNNYSNEHSKLPVYNVVHQHCRDAAISLGHWQFDKTIRHLEILNRMITQGTIYRLASMYNRNQL